MTASFDPDQTAAKLGNFICPLSGEHSALLSIEGPDSSKFLQGQTTCDVQQVTTSSARYGGYCTPKGRVLATFLAASPAENHLLLRLRADLAEGICQRLAKYIVFSKAEIRDASEDWQLYGLAGEQAGQWLTENFGASPGEGGEVHMHDGALIIASETGLPMWELWLPKSQSLPDCSLDQAATAQWQAAQIFAGRAEVSSATSEAFIPQVLNMDITGAVNFKKGCYTGQEVIARLHYRGKSKRRSFAFALETSDTFSEGSEVYAEGNAQAIGDVVLSSPGLALISMTVATADATTLNIDGNVVGVGRLPLPYAVDLNDED